MQQVRRACLRCGRMTAGGSYCRAHAPAPLSATFRRISRVMLREHRRLYGDWCPGADDLQHTPHRAEAGNPLTVDHVLQRRDGGTDDPANLRVLCRRANSARR